MYKERLVPLSVKNAHPELYGYPTPALIPGNSEKKIVVPCAPFEDSDGDVRWVKCESKEQAYYFRNEFRKETLYKERESRCIVLSKKKNIYVRCSADCMHCRKLIEAGLAQEDGTTPNYQRTGNPISLDFKYDEDDEDENEHDIPDTETPTPEQALLLEEEERMIQNLIAERDELDRKIIEILLEDNTKTDEEIHALTNTPRRTIAYRRERLKKWVLEVFKK